MYIRRCCPPRDPGIVIFSGSWERTATSVLLDARVFRGVLPPSLPVPLPPRRHPRDPLISGLRGSRNEPSEARWHEEGNVGWVVEGRRREGRELFKITLSRPRNAHTPPRPISLCHAATTPVFVKDTNVEGVPYLKTSSSARLVNVLRFRSPIAG